MYGSYSPYTMSGAASDYNKGIVACISADIPFLQVATHQKAYMQVAHAMLAWHTGTHSPTSAAGHRRGTRTGHTDVQRLDGKQAKVTDHQDVHSMQLVTNTHSRGSHGERSGQMQPPAASCWLSSDDQQFLGDSGCVSQQVQMHQPIQHVHVSQLCQQGGVHQMSSMLNHADLHQQQHDVPDEPQRVSSHGSDDQVQLSYSMDEGQSAELDLQSSAMSHLMGATAGQETSLHADALLCPSSGFPKVSEALPKVIDDESHTRFAVRTEEALLLHVRTKCATVQEHMAVSPSAVHGRRKQARLDSARCLKF